MDFLQELMPSLKQLFLPAAAEAAPPKNARPPSGATGAGVPLNERREAETLEARGAMYAGMYDEGEMASSEQAAFVPKAAAPQAAPGKAPAGKSKEPAPPTMDEIPDTHVPSTQDPKAMMEAVRKYAEREASSRGNMKQRDYDAMAEDKWVEQYKSEHDGAAPRFDERSRYRVTHAYNNEGDIKKHECSGPPPKQEVDLSTPEKRLEAMQYMTQESPDDFLSGARCGPTALIAGAMLANGPDGLLAVVNAMNGCVAGDPEKQKKMNEDLVVLKYKIKTGQKLNYGDLTDLSKGLYTVMNQELEGEDPEEILKTALEPGTSKEDKDKAEQQLAVKSSSFQKLFAKSPELAEMFKNNELRLSMPDRTGSGHADHYVLKIGSGDDAAIYDPQQRAGGQIITNDRGVMDYETLQKVLISGPPPG